MSLASALKTGDLTELPSRRDEDWRWTDLRGLIRVLPPATRLPDGCGAVDYGWAPFSGLATREVSVLNGSISGLGNDRIAPLVFDKYDPVVTLHVVSVATHSSHSAAIKIVVPEGLKATLLEVHGGRGEDYVASFELYIELAAGSSLERIVLTNEEPSAIVVVDAEVRVGPGATFNQTILTTGAKRQRIETRVAHPGGGASVRLDGVYLVSAQRHADITTVVTHQGVDGTTDQLIKGVASDQGRGVFQGRIVVSEGADRTDARMGHHALLLSDRAEVDAKPELEIYADDVSCAHGNTVGALDDEALFYARQRGIPEADARAMLTEAFLGEVIDRIGHEGARDAARAWMAERRA